MYSTTNYKYQQKFNFAIVDKEDFLSWHKRKRNGIKLSVSMDLYHFSSCPYVTVSVQSKKESGENINALIHFF